MIRYFSNQKPLSQSLQQPPEDCSPENIVWVDLFAATEEERESICHQFQIDHYKDIERRLLQDPNWHDLKNDAVIFWLPFSTDQPGRPYESGIIFILTQHTLITEHKLGFDLAAKWLAEGEFTTRSSLQAADLLIDLLEYLLIIFSSKATIISMNISELSRKVFVEPKDQSRSWRRAINLRAALRKIGQIGAVSLALNDHLHWLERIPLFLLAEAGSQFKDTRQTRLESMRQDVITLIESVVFIQQQNTLVLEATLGIINLEENSVMRWLAVIATIFIPPTFIASVYGMNFSEFSSLGGSAALPIALALVMLSGLIPIFFFARRGWL